MAPSSADLNWWPPTTSKINSLNCTPQHLLLTRCSPFGVWEDIFEIQRLTSVVAGRSGAHSDPCSCDGENDQSRERPRGSPFSRPGPDLTKSCSSKKLLLGFSSSETQRAISLWSVLLLVRSDPRWA